MVIRLNTQVEKINGWRTRTIFGAPIVEIEAHKRDVLEAEW